MTAPGRSRPAIHRGRRPPVQVHARLLGSGGEGRGVRRDAEPYGRRDWGEGARARWPTGCEVARPRPVPVTRAVTHGQGDRVTPRHVRPGGAGVAGGPRPAYARLPWSISVASAPPIWLPASPVSWMPRARSCAPLMRWGRSRGVTSCWSTVPEHCWLDDSRAAGATRWWWRRSPLGNAVADGSLDLVVSLWAAFRGVTAATSPRWTGSCGPVAACSSSTTTAATTCRRCAIRGARVPAPGAAARARSCVAAASGSVSSTASGPSPARTTRASAGERSASVAPRSRRPAQAAATRPGTWPSTTAGRAGAPAGRWRGRRRGSLTGRCGDPASGRPRPPLLRSAA